MAKFISIYSSGAGLAGGDILVSGEATGVVANSATETVIYLKGGTAGDTATITHSSTGTVPSVRDAIIYALTANPGGIKAKVKLPSGITVSVVAFS
jgi:excinuclease UvrABC ATPase subunit